MINVTKKHKCSGCSACANACPKKCISMRPDIEGFVYPEVDMRKCVECNICTQVCPFINPYPISKSKQAYACKSKDETVRISSSSGGIFSLIADYFLDRGGVVFGAGFDENMKLVHQSVDTKEALKLLRGSKYVQSDMGNCFSEAKMLLDDGKLVLFSGTPCQISGLRHFLNKGYDNLFCADVVCHGVPSPSVWKSYVSYQEKKPGLACKM